MPPLLLTLWCGCYTNASTIWVGTVYMGQFFESIQFRRIDFGGRNSCHFFESIQFRRIDFGGRNSYCLEVQAFLKIEHTYEK